MYFLCVTQTCVHCFDSNPHIDSEPKQMACLLFVLVLSQKVSSSPAGSHFLLIHRFSDVTVSPATMRSSVLLCLGFSFALFGFGESLQCYSCPDGPSTSCEVKQDCNQGEDSCLKLISGAKTFTTCMRYADCDFMTLAVRYAEPDFTFSCCQSNLCNGIEKSAFQKFKDFFG